LGSEATKGSYFSFSTERRNYVTTYILSNKYLAVKLKKYSPLSPTKPRLTPLRPCLLLLIISFLKNKKAPKKTIPEGFVLYLW
jgi:hypothetical protein